MVNLLYEVLSLIYFLWAANILFVSIYLITKSIPYVFFQKKHNVHLKMPLTFPCYPQKNLHKLMMRLNFSDKIFAINLVAILYSALFIKISAKALHRQASNTIALFFLKKLRHYLIIYHHKLSLSPWVIPIKT